MTAEEVLRRAISKVVHDFEGEPDDPETTTGFFHQYIEDEFPVELMSNPHFVAGLLCGITMLEEKWVEDMMDEL